MGFTDSIRTAAAYCALGHRLTATDPVGVVQMPDGQDFVTFNFEADGSDTRFSRQMILEACNSTPDAASRFDDFLAASYPELVADWHSALAAAAARGADHALALAQLRDAAPVMIGSLEGADGMLFVNADASEADIEKLSTI